MAKKFIQTHAKSGNRLESDVISSTLKKSAGKTKDFDIKNEPKIITKSNNNTTIIILLSVIGIIEFTNLLFKIIN